MLPLSEKMKVLDLIKKKLYAEATKIYDKNKYSICEIVKRGKRISASFSVTPQTAKVIGNV